MPATVAVDDLKIGMFVQLDLGWMSHPFPLSSFKISSADQIAKLKALGLAQVTWLPERSTLPADSGVIQLPTPSPRPGPVDPAAREAARRRELLRVQRRALHECEAQYHEAAEALRTIDNLLDPAPEAAAGQAGALSRALLDKMVGERDLCIRLLTTAAGDRAAAHALNVTVIALLMGRALELPETEMMDIGTGALLHDIGKRDLPSRVHHPDEHFTSAELKAYREHVALGVKRGQRMGLAGGVLQVVAQHHELADGTGFPGRLGVDAMSPAARIVALVNRYDNLCNPGPLAAALTPHEALSSLFAQNRSKYDVAFLSSFIRMMGVYPAGSVVQLTDDRYALVMQVNSSRPLKPRVLVHDAKVPVDEALLLDLEQHPDLGIRRSLPVSKLPPAAAAYLAPRPRVAYFFQPLDACEPDQVLEDAA